MVLVACWGHRFTRPAPAPISSTSFSPFPSSPPLSASTKASSCPSRGEGKGSSVGPSPTGKCQWPLWEAQERPEHGASGEAA